jgi:hypothetical protein
MGGKRMMKATKKLPKEVTVATQPMKGKKHPFTAGPALVDVGTAKFEDA